MALEQTGEFLDGSGGVSHNHGASKKRDVTDGLPQLQPRAHSEGTKPPISELALRTEPRARRSGVERQSHDRTLVAIDPAST